MKEGLEDIKHFSFSGFEELINQLIDSCSLSAELIDKGFVNFDRDNPESIFEASSFIFIVQKNTGTLVNCPEEIAYRRGIISKEELIKLATIKGSRYLLDL